jgi:aminoglycoside phosphotransferase (APT) family kinase protein
MGVVTQAGGRPGTRPTTGRHRFNEAGLAAWLGDNLAGFEGPLAVRQFVGGQSNPTYHLQAASGEYVLRKKPPGQLVASAHAIDREYRVLRALAGSDVPVPNTRLYCDDASVIGTPFYLMDYQPGRIFTDPLLPGMTPAERAGIYDAMNDALARLHGFDWSAAGLGDFGRPAQYVSRQLARWSRQYREARTEIVPAMDQLGEWLAANVPAGEAAAIAHGDFRIGNLIFDEHEPKVVAILDWELSTIGHPLCDLAYNCMTYHLPAGHVVAAGFVGVDRAALGIPSESEYLDAYARRTGRREVPDWPFYMAFSLYRTAAIQHGVYCRALAGNASSEVAHLFGDCYQMVARAGWAIVRDAGHGPPL